MNGSSKPPHKRKFRNGKNKKTKTIAYSQPDYRFVCCRKKCRHSAYYKCKSHPAVHTGQKSIFYLYLCNFIYHNLNFLLSIIL